MWPEAIRRLLVKSKGIALVVNDDQDAYAECPNGVKGYCDGEECREPVQTDFLEDGTACYYIECPMGKDAMVSVPSEMMERFVVDDSAWAHWLSLRLQTDTMPELCLNEGDARLWRLGTALLGDYWLPCYLAIGTRYPATNKQFQDAAAFRAGELALVFVPDEIPRAIIGANIHRRSLRQYVSLSETALDFNREALIASLKSLPMTKQRRVKLFPTPEGTSWDQVLITVINTTAVTVSVRGAIDGRSYDDLGFCDMKRELPSAKQEDLGVQYEWNECWEHFLRLAYYNGEVTIEQWANGATRNTVSSWAGEINACLQAVIRIDADDAIYYSRKDKVYRSSFILQASDSCRAEIHTKGLLTKRYLGRIRPDSKKAVTDDARTSIRRG